MTPAEDTGWILFLAIGFLIGGFVAMYFARRLWKLAEASKTWPAASGTILVSDVRDSETDPSDPTKSVTTYTPVVEYEYSVSGEPLRGNRIRFGGAPQSTQLSKAQAVAGKYPVGSQVNVYYNPAKPAQCTLDQEISLVGTIMLFVFGAIFVIAGAGLFLLRGVIAGA